jgi:hypothetical protein
VGAGKKAAGASAPAAKKMGGFGSVGKPAAGQDDGEKYARDKFGTQKGISSDEFFGRNAFDPSATAQAKERLSGTFLPFPSLPFPSLPSEKTPLLTPPPRRLRRRLGHLIHRVLRAARRRRARGRLRRPRGRRKGLCAQVWYHSWRRHREPVQPARRGRNEAAGRYSQLSQLVGGFMHGGCGCGNAVGGQGEKTGGEGEMECMCELSLRANDVFFFCECLMNEMELTTTFWLQSDSRFVADHVDPPVRPRRDDVR